MRAIPALSFLLVFAVLAGCQSDHEKELEAQLENARTQASDLEASVSQLEDAVDGLRSAVDGFNDTNWREVVGDVESATSEIESASEAVSTAASDTVDAVAEQ